MTSAHLRFQPDDLVALAGLLDGLAERIAATGGVAGLAPAPAGRDEVSVAAATSLRDAATGLRGGVDSGAAELHRVASALRHLATSGVDADITAATTLCAGHSGI